jgi:nitrite reductase/ring-hydroxylating ferredoxin subunit
MARYKLTTPDAIPANTMRAFDLSGRRVLVVNLDGSFYALDDLCPHLAVPLSRGELKDGCVTCPGHGSVFDVKSGEAKKWVGKQINFLTRMTEGRAKSARVYRPFVEEGQLTVEL